MDNLWPKRRELHVQGNKGLHGKSVDHEKKKRKGRRTRATGPGNGKGGANNHIRPEKGVEKTRIVRRTRNTDGVLTVNWAETPATKRAAKRREKE